MRLPRGREAMNSKTILKLLLDDGWEIVRTKGSHHQLEHVALNLVAFV
jgi:predicted RNA binding protein YcfA (HicA-like mRNA interferase family)